jgi:SAM-dependent methyltransferase
MPHTDVNYWADDDCAKAVWDQHLLPPYQELLTDTVRCLNPQPGERWLDLGCGNGQLAAALWRLAQGEVAEIVALDCAAINAEAIARLRAKLQPRPREDQLHFLPGNFSTGLARFPNASFDGIVSGLAISYAEHWDEAAGRYTDQAYNHLLAELHRVLKPDGRLVFSVNVPNPKWGRILAKSIGRGFRVSKPLRFLVNGFRMMRYGRWLKREARRGRFHYLPLPEIVTRLQCVGFGDMKCRLSYAGQAYVIYARRPGLAARQVA